VHENASVKRKIERSLTRLFIIQMDL